MSPRYYLTSSGSLLFFSLRASLRAGRQSMTFSPERMKAHSLSSTGFSLTLTFGSNWWTVCLRPPLHSEQVSCPKITTHSHTCTNKNTLRDSQTCLSKKTNFSQGISTAKGSLRSRFLKYSRVSHNSVLEESTECSRHC